MSRGTAKNVADVIASAGELTGRTRLQKTVALLELAGVGYGFDFSYYRFGPFSEDLVIAAERAAALNYIEEIPKVTSWGGRFSIYRSPNQRASGDEARDRLIAIAKDADSIILELAVTAAFLAVEGEEDPWGEVAARKPEKVTRARLAEAKRLYKAFEGVAVPRPLPAIN